MNKQPIGLFALWKITPTGYHAVSPGKNRILENVQRAFQAAEKEGTHLYNLFEVHWQTEWEYFAFWETPTFITLQDAMERLEAAGDFNYARSKHIIGRKIADEYASEVKPGILDQRTWWGCVTTWKWTSSYYQAGQKELQEVEQRISTLHNRLKGVGGVIFGQYNARFSSVWDRFVFGLLPSYSLYEEFIREFEDMGLYQYLDAKHTAGKANQAYRFAESAA